MFIMQKHALSEVLLISDSVLCGHTHLAPVQSAPDIRWTKGFIKEMIRMYSPVTDSL